jgi:hypothetical protein
MDVSASQAMGTVFTVGFTMTIYGMGTRGGNNMLQCVHSSVVFFLFLEGNHSDSAGLLKATANCRNPAELLFERLCKPSHYMTRTKIRINT